MPLRALAVHAPSSVRHWTGRSALTSATETPRPHLATAGTRQTRVSAMRLLAPRAGAALGAAPAAGKAIAQRRGIGARPRRRG